MQSPLVLILRPSQKPDKDTLNQVRFTLLPCWINSSIQRASQRAHGFAVEALGVRAQSSTSARGHTTKVFTSLVLVDQSPICGRVFCFCCTLRPVLVLRVFRPCSIFNGCSWYVLSQSTTFGMSALCSWQNRIRVNGRVPQTGTLHLSARLIWQGHLAKGAAPWHIVHNPVTFASD